MQWHVVNSTSWASAQSLSAAARLRNAPASFSGQDMDAALVKHTKPACTRSLCTFGAIFWALQTSANPNKMCQSRLLGEDVCGCCPTDLLTHVLDLSSPLQAPYLKTSMATEKVELLDLIKDGWFEETQSFWSGMCPCTCMSLAPHPSPLRSLGPDLDKPIAKVPRCVCYGIEARISLLTNPLPPRL